MTTRLSAAEGGALAALAVAAVGARLAGGTVNGCPPASAVLRACGASFVTLEAAGALRGCIGTIEPVRPLYLDVMRNATRAMNDPRLPPVSVLDWPELDVKVAVLTAPEPLAATDLDGLVAQLRPGVDGLLLTDGDRRATFLPAVWEKLPEPDGFVTALLRKGGWPARPWPAGLSASRYGTAEFWDSAPRQPLPTPAQATHQEAR
jgi:AmmeMemoRadiSam system protein A